MQVCLFLFTVVYMMDNIVPLNALVGCQVNVVIRMDNEIVQDEF